MATSGTATFALDYVEIIEEAYERCGLESRSGYDMLTARRSINLMMLEWANRGVNLWTVDARSQVLTSGTGTYTLAADIVDIIEQVISIPNASTETRYPLTRVSVNTFATRTNPALTGRPTQIYINRAQAAPTVQVWPVPNDSYTMYYWTLSRIEDAGAYTNNPDVPFRFLPVFIAGLAWYLAEKKAVDNENLIMRLKGRYAEEWANAADEDRERATLSITPRMAR